MTVEKFVTRFIALPIIVMGYALLYVSVYVDFIEAQKETPFPEELQQFDQRYNATRKAYGIPILPDNFSVKRYIPKGSVEMENPSKDVFPNHISKRIDLRYDGESAPDSVFRELDIFQNVDEKKKVVKLRVLSLYTEEEKISGRLTYSSGGTVELSKMQVDSVLLSWGLKY